MQIGVSTTVETPICIRLKMSLNKNVVLLLRFRKYWREIFKFYS